MATRNQVCKAIRKQTLVTFKYNGLERTAELYRQGKNRDTDIDEVRAYQTAGESSSGDLGWKLFVVKDIKNLKSTETSFDIRKDHKDSDSAIYTYCQV